MTDDHWIVDGDSEKSGNLCATAPPLPLPRAGSRTYGPFHAAVPSLPAASRKAGHRCLSASLSKRFILPHLIDPQQVNFILLRKSYRADGTTSALVGQMMKAALVVLMLASMAPSSFAQARPDFSGTWTLDEKRSGSATHEAFVSPVIWVIKQSPEMLILERRHGANDPLTFQYAIAAKGPVRGPDPVAPSGEAPGHRGHWDGEQLILETHQNIQGKTVTTRETLGLTPNGELVAERVLEVEHGYTLKGAQNFSAVKDFFTKRAPQ